ncbi:hypothetical protein SAY86_007542 [Trapa natans]|uniref:DUF7731 domain-containing protein n=1 Tax=Trapa natans TaxID=22666 RepID=A0AAN7R290_TRANT|nr:hypothetical protein SAY86_007542 [Trapa natans]
MDSALINPTLHFSVAAILYISVNLCCCQENPEGGVPQLGGVYKHGAGGVDGFRDPPQIVAKSLLCFNADYIYKSCEESYRLGKSGDLYVPPEYTFKYCTGPCLRETNLVLGCIERIFDKFLFYNRATLKDVRDTIRAGCSYGPERGHFDVAEHIAAEGDGSSRVAAHILTQLVGIFLGRLLLLEHV